MIRIDQIQANLIRVVTPTAQVWFSHERPIAYAIRQASVILRDPGVSTTTRRHQRIIDPACTAGVLEDTDFVAELRRLTKGA
jgi:hypothetical protein